MNSPTSVVHNLDLDLARTFVAICETGNFSRAAEVIDQSGPVGEILDDKLTIGCGTGALRPTCIQRPGKSVMDTDAVLRGYDKLAKGVKLG